MSVNKAFLVGKVSNEIDLHYTNSGAAVCSFSLKTVERFKSKAGEKQERTETHNIVAWADLAEFCEKSLEKGTQVYIEGRIQRKTIEEDGNKKYLTEIIALKIELLDNSASDDADDGPFDPDSIPF